jgi:hypothetical protein
VNQGLVWSRFMKKKRQKISRYCPFKEDDSDVNSYLIVDDSDVISYLNIDVPDVDEPALYILTAAIYENLTTLGYIMAVVGKLLTYANLRLLTLL